MAASNYAAICKEQKERYGTIGAQKSGQLAAERYDDRTHFIFELLQNAEDALRRRGEWHGPRQVTVKLTPAGLMLSHFGQPFNEADVRSVCEFAESTKGASAIGRFGIGFKSVYTVTDRPEIHSGEEDFAIEGYVFPRKLTRTRRAADETQIVLPLKAGDASALQEIATGFKQLGPRVLLFLRHINEIEWTVEGGASGVYLRSAPEQLGDGAQRIRVIGQEAGQPEVDENWLVFRREVSSPSGGVVGCVEIAFALSSVGDEPGQWSVHPLAASPLVVFFPTVLSTNLGFLVQGPYVTTPSRDNVPRSEPWNQNLVLKTADLLVEAVRWMRDNSLLDTAALRCLPMSREKFPEGSMFAPLFEVLRQAFLKERLLPRVDGGFVSAGQAKLARTQELRDLFGARQIGKMFGEKGCAWLSGDITQDRTPELRTYLLRELEVPEITPDRVVPRLTKAFLEAQSNAWVTRLYGFLNGQKALASLYGMLPLIRLDDGTHVVAHENGRPNAFLPSDIDTSFPTVHRAVCGTPESRGFLLSLGLTEPDPVDDVVWNVLPRYRTESVDHEQDEYARDIARILAAFKTDSKAQREKLLKELRETSFVMVVDTGGGKDAASEPGDVYIATERLKELFTGVPGVFLVDDKYECLRGEDVRDLLVACGASRYLDPQPTSSTLTEAEKSRLRKEAGLERSTWQQPPEDFTLRGLRELLQALGELSHEDARARATVLWDALVDLVGRGTGWFSGSYRWGYSHEYKSAHFDASFVRELNEARWIPDANGDLVRPALVAFESLGWRPNPFLQSKITFKPPIIDQLAKEAGFEPALLDLLRKHGITSAEAAARFGLVSRPEEDAPREAAPDDKSETSDGAEPVPAAPLEGAGGAAGRNVADAAESAPTLVGSYPLEQGQTEEETAASAPPEPRINPARQPRPTSGEHRADAARPGQRRITGQVGLDEQAARLRRRVASFFGGTAPDTDDEATEEDTVAWRTKLVCLDADAGGLQLQVGPLGGLPQFVKKLRAIGNEDGDAFVLASNARLRPTRAPVRPGTGPWRWEAVGFEDEDDLGLGQLALDALDVTRPSLFRVDADDVGQLSSGTTLSPGQCYRVLLPPSIGGESGAPLGDGWRIWSLDLTTLPSPSTCEALRAIGLEVGEPSLRLEWALTCASAWRTNARGHSYAVFAVGTPLDVNVNGVDLSEGDEAMLFLHGPTGTERLALSTNGLVSLGTPAAGQWACSLVHSRTNVQIATLVFEVAEGATDHLSPVWAASMPNGPGSLEATAPPGWPIAVRWGGLAAHIDVIATVYGNDDHTVPFEGVHPLLEARASRAPVADLVVDLRELGHRVILVAGRASLDVIRTQLMSLWHQRAEFVQGRRGMWLPLMSAWFEPAASRLGYGIERLAMPDGADAPHDLVAHLLTIDERTAGGITRSPSRVLILTTDVDSVLRDLREWIDHACSVARVRDAIVTDGTRWVTHRKGDRQLRRRDWSLGGNALLGSVDEMMNELTEGW